MTNEVHSLTNDQIKNRIRALESETISMKSEMRNLREKMSKHYKIYSTRKQRVQNKRLQRKTKIQHPATALNIHSRRDLRSRRSTGRRRR